MKSFTTSKRKKNLAMVSIFTATVIGLSGCSLMPQTMNPNPDPAPTVTETQEPAAEPTMYGDVMTLIEDGEPVILTNEHGEYEHITIDPESDAFSDDSVIDEASVEDVGYTMDDAVEAQEFIATWIAEEVIDGPGLDSDEGYEEWVDEESRDVIDPSQYDSIIETPEGGQSLIVANKEVNEGPFIADGGARVNEATIDIDSIEGIEQDGESYFSISGSASVEYRLSDKAVIDAALKRLPDATRADIIAEFPKLDDEDSENTYVKGVDYTYYLNEDLQFAGYNVQYDEGELLGFE